MPRVAYRVWRLLFAPRVARPVDVPIDLVARGRYLAEHGAACADCHTERTRWGAPKAGLHLAGTAHGPDGDSVPNITPDAETGIGGWSEGSIVHLLRTGTKQDGDDVEGSMAEVSKGMGGGPGFASAPESELRSIAMYLKTVPPIRNQSASRAFKAAQRVTRFAGVTPSVLNAARHIAFLLSASRQGRDAATGARGAVGTRVSPA